LERLRKRFVDLRREPRQENVDDAIKKSLALAQRIRDLQTRVTALAERPHDFLYYTPEQLRRRRDLYRLTQSELDDLRRQEARALRQALELPKPQRGEIPPAEIARARRQREEARKDALQALEALERGRLEAARGQVLPPPMEMPAPAAPVDDAAPARDSMVAALRANKVKRTPHLPAGAPADVIAAVRRRRESLRQSVLADIRVAAVAAGSRLGLAVTFDRGRAPDRTDDLLGPTREILNPARGSLRGR
jgi:hypothetical protein